MAWGRKDSRDEVKGLLAALERQASEASRLAERAQRDMDSDRFASFLDFRRKVEEIRALFILTEERLQGIEEARLSDLHAEFERMDLLLTRMLVRSMRRYFSGMREDQVLPIGARDLFEPELRSIDQTRTRLLGPRYANSATGDMLEDLDATADLIRKTIARAPSLPDFSDNPSPPKPRRRLRTLGRPIRS
ncbi:hypothetical protein JHL17_21385 [Azospirillum sp. YIM B02556]|uniref:Uncharacterized protein n=1 Tax=Azospirillum endophyticum TaxID=2800326 RepID=A0ABS1F955_9PROT|nr:hypothetical protein [Azospirillum endophyticum]MBK1839964.1 hypothetical protein [Azospirillum endophyticum]